MAKMVVTFIQSTKAMKIQVTELCGKFFGALLISMLTSVAPAMIAAKGNEVANPHPWVCGFITLIHTHISAPIYGCLKILGNMPKTIRVTRISLMRELELLMNGCLAAAAHAVKDSALLKVVNYLGDAILKRQLAGSNHQLGIEWLLIGRRDSCKFFYFPGSCPFIQAFYIPPLAHVEAGVAKNFNKIAVRKNAARSLAISPKGRDECSHRNHARLDQQLGGLAYTPDILGAVLSGKAEGRAHTLTHVI